MALGDPTTSFLDDWYAAMMQQPAPMQVTAPEYGSTVPIGPGPTTPAPPPPPPPPPPQQVGPVGMPAPVDEVAPAEIAAQPAAVQPEPAPMMPGFESSIVDPSTWGGGTDTLPTPDMQLAEVGGGLDQYGMEKLPTMPELPADSIINPDAWQSEAAPIGHTRTGVAPGEQGMSLEERQRLKLENPLAYEKLKIDEVEDQAAQARAGMAQIERRSAEEAELSLRNFRESQRRSQEMMKQVELDVAALANEKPKKYEAGALDLIAGVLGMLGASATGGKNVGLELVNQRIDRHIQEQRDEYNRKAGNVDRKMNLIAKLRDAGYDDYQAGEVIRLSSLERAKQMLMTDIQNYDPQGTTARNKMAQYERFAAEQVKRAEALRVRDLDEKIKQGEYFIKARKADDEHNKAMRVGTGAPSLDKQKFSSDELSRMFPGQPVPTDGIPRTTREYDQWLGTRGKGEELVSKQRGNEQFDSEQERQLGVRGPDGGFLVGDDNKPVKMKDTDEAKKLTQSIADTDEYVRMMDEVLRLRTKYGWSSDLFKSPEWRQAKTTWAALSLQKKNLDGLGALTGSDIDILHESMGASDPTSLRDPTPGIETARRHAVKKIEKNLTVRGVGQKSLPQYPETWKNQAPAPTAVDEAIREVTQADQLVDDRPGKIPLGPTGAPAGSTKEAYEHFKAQTTKVRDRVQFLEDTARGGGDNGKKARQGLVELAGGKAGSPLMREAAEQALRNLATSEAATKEEVK